MLIKYTTVINKITEYQRIRRQLGVSGAAL